MSVTLNINRDILARVTIIQHIRSQSTTDVGSFFKSYTTAESCSGQIQDFFMWKLWMTASAWFVSSQGKKCNECMKYNHYAHESRQFQNQKAEAHSVTSDNGCINQSDNSSESDFFVDSVCTDTGHNQAFVNAKTGPTRKKLRSTPVRR